MSMALYVIVRPSSVLSVLVHLMCAAVLGIAVAIGFGLVSGDGVGVRALLAICCAFAVGVVLYQNRRHRFESHIQVDGLGQIRLELWRAGRGHSRQNDADCLLRQTEVGLMPSSTIWPWLLLLRLRTGSGRVWTTLILPDCLSESQFRELAVVCRWIAARRHTLKY